MNGRRDDNFPSTYLSAHNPQTPSNAQIRLLETELEGEHLRGITNDGGPSTADRYFHSNTDSLKIGNPSFSGSQAKTPISNSHASSRSKLNRDNQRASVEKLNEERSLAFQHAGETQLRSSSTNLLERLTPDVALMKHKKGGDGTSASKVPKVLPMDSSNENLIVPDDSGVVHFVKESQSTQHKVT